jgi:ribosomal protein S27E
MINLSINDLRLHSVSYSVNNGPDEVLHQPFIIDTTNWQDGDYIIELIAVDNSNNINKSWYKITIDSTLPMIMLISHNNNSVINAEYDLEFEVSDLNLNGSFYKLDNGESVSFSEPYIIDLNPLSEGEFKVTIFAGDLAGNFNEMWFIFTKDTLSPEIELTSPQNGSWLNDPYIIDFNVDDINLKSVQYSINYGTVTDLEEPYEIDSAEWDEGEYIITIIAEDMANNNDEKWFLFKMDTSFPSIESTSLDDDLPVDINPEILVEFSEPMNTQSVEDSFSISPSVGHSFSWSNDNKTLTIICDEPLEYGTLYKISIETIAKDLADRGMEEKFELEFTTETESKVDEGEEFPVLYLLVALLGVVIIIVLILVMVIAKKKKTPVNGIETGVIEEVVQAPQTIQFTCSNCNNLLQATDNGTSQNVTCSYCSTNLTVPSQIVANTSQSSYQEQPQIQPQSQTTFPEPQVQSPTIQISCPKCRHKFSVVKSQGTIQVQCPNCGTNGKMG